MGKILAFVSGKGGTGKTSMCAAVSSCLAEAGMRVLCVDLDVGLRNLDLALAMTEEGIIPFTSVMDGTYTPEQLTPHVRYPGLYLLTAPVNTEPEDIGAEEFSVFLAGLRDAFDFVLLDAPAGVGNLFRLAAEGADEVIVVTGGDKATLRDAARAAQLLDGKPARLLVNRLQTKLFTRMKTTVDDIMDEVSLPLLGLVPEDPSVPLSAMQGNPLLLRPRTGAAKACRRVAHRLMGRKIPLGRL